MRTFSAEETSPARGALRIAMSLAVFVVVLVGAFVLCTRFELPDALVDLVVSLALLVSILCSAWIAQRIGGDDYYLLSLSEERVSLCVKRPGSAGDHKMVRKIFDLENRHLARAHDSLRPVLDKATGLPAYLTVRDLSGGRFELPSFFVEGEPPPPPGRRKRKREILHFDVYEGQIRAFAYRVVERSSPNSLEPAQAHFSRSPEPVKW